jgi:hypothetical protein
MITRPEATEAFRPYVEERETRFGRAVEGDVRLSCGGDHSSKPAKQWRRKP